MATSTVRDKDPDEVLDYHFNWAPWLQDGESITSATFEINPGISIDSALNTNTVATAWLSGGLPGQLYRLRCRVNTNQGRVSDRSMTIRVGSR